MREKLFIFLLVLGFGILATRLFVLQVVQGAYWRELSEGNRIKTIKISALRGVVYDRNGEQLVRNTPEGREYIYGQVLAHVLGYVGEISGEELDEAGQANPVIVYQQGDLVGKEGIEREYDSYLRGQDGGEIEEVDSNGEKVRVLGKVEPVEGQNLTLSIDLALQEKVFEALEGKKGAVVISNPENGEILALVSSPSYDSNILTAGVEGVKKAKNTESEIKEILNNEDQPMFNRAVSGLYPPGSTFKIVSALGALQEDKITVETEVEDKGVLKVGRWEFGNWYFNQYGRTDGMVDIVKAIKRSNDIFFYKVGQWLGIDKLSYWARKFGYGKISGIDLPGEEAGLVPDKEWKREYKDEDWYLGDDFITAIGQGDLLATPLQVNMMTASVANNGKLCKPNVVQSPKDLVQKKCEDLGIKKEYIELVKEGMEGACQSAGEGDTGGTGWPLFEFKVKNKELEIDDKNYLPPTASDSADIRRIPVACKTGTAESPGEESKPHAWFTLYVPVKDPQMVLTILLEKGGEGSSDAGPIAKEILKWWYERI